MSVRVVAIDGAAGSGKSTLARSLARALGLPYINTGLMYRALAAAARRVGVGPDEAERLIALTREMRFTLRGTDPPELVIEGYATSDLTSPEVESTVSAVSRHPDVRAWMRERQRELGRDGAVMEGRDIASVVFPDAPVKLFLRASEQARTVRRADERAATDPARIADELRARDERDAATTALEAATGAIVIDTDQLDVAGTLDAALDAVRRVWPESDA